MRIPYLVAFLTAIWVGAFVACVAGPRQSGSVNPNAATALAGTWRLVSFESRTAGGGVRHQLGPAPKGQLVYDARGYMSAQLMNPERPEFGSGDLTQGTDAEVRAAVAGYIAYYGKYTVDESQGMVTHHVQGALFPNWVGGEQVRYYRLEGTCLRGR